MTRTIIGIIAFVIGFIVGRVVRKKKCLEKYATVGEKGDYKTIEEANEAGEKKINIL